MTVNAQIELNSPRLDTVRFVRCVVQFNPAVMRMCYVQAAAAVRAVFNIDVEDPFEQSGPN